MKINIWDLIHNLIAHPLMGFSLYSNWSMKFHDWTADKMPK